jgi:hypothetical protein
MPPLAVIGVTQCLTLAGVVARDMNDSLGARTGAAPGEVLRAGGHIDRFDRDVSIVIERIKARRNRGATGVADTLGLFDVNLHAADLTVRNHPQHVDRQHPRGADGGRGAGSRENRIHWAGMGTGSSKFA